MTRSTFRKLLDAARVIQLTPGIRAWLEANDPKALAQLERAIADGALELESNPAARPAQLKRARLEFLQRQVEEQRAWIRSCGGDLAGYISHYGDPDQERCYGNGGTAIYAADMGELHRLEAELQRIAS